MRFRHVLEYNFLVFRHAWKPIIWTFISPVLFLISMGWGVGTLVNHQAGGVGGVHYVDFIAPGILASTTMQMGAMDGTWSVLGKIVWRYTYQSMISTSLGTNQIIFGEMSWFTLRLLSISIFYWLVMLSLGLIHTPWALLIIPVAVLTGLAFAMPLTALSGIVKDDRIFILIFRLGIMPLFLLAGAFFPINRLPSLLQSAAWFTPTFHGVAWAREITLGAPLQLPIDLLHLGVLLGFIGIGTLLAQLSLSRRLRK